MSDPTDPATLPVGDGGPPPSLEAKQAASADEVRAMIELWDKQNAAASQGETLGVADGSEYDPDEEE